MEKIIFLDIDGVILNYNRHKEPESKKLKEYCFAHRKKFSHIHFNPLFVYSYLLDFDKHAIKLINQLAEDTNAKIVVHSDWIKCFDEKQIYDKLIHEGINEEFMHSDYIGHFHRLSQEKIHYVEWWIEDNEKNGSKFKYVIIDDQLGVKGHPIVNPASNTGFNEKDFAKAKKFLE